MELQVGNSGIFYVDFGDGVSQPFQRGLVVPKFQRDESGAPTGKMALIDTVDINAPVMNFTAYGSIINGNTGNPFVSLASLIAFCAAYIYQTNDIAGTSVALQETLYVVDVPAAGNEVAPGATIEHSFLASGVVQYIFLNGSFISESYLVHNTGSPNGTLQYTGRDFETGDVIVISKNP